MPEVKCENCKKTFHKSPSQFKKSKAHFCCRWCLYEYRTMSEDFIHFHKKEDSDVQKISLETNKGKECSRPSCTRKAKIKGLCLRCYNHKLSGWKTYRKA